MRQPLYYLEIFGWRRKNLNLQAELKFYLSGVNLFFNSAESGIYFLCCNTYIVSFLLAILYPSVFKVFFDA